MPDVEGQRLQLGIDSLAIYLVRGQDTVPTGMVWDELSRVDEDGTSVLRRVYRSQDRVLGLRVDTLVDEYASLQARRHRSRTTHSQEFLRFSEGRVNGWVRLVNGDSAAVDVQVPSAVYNASSFDLILRAAPLAEGWSAEVPAFLPSTRSIVPLRARVVGREMIDTESCWRVDAHFGGTPVTFWIAEPSRTLCQQVMHIDADTRILFRRVRPTPSPSVPRRST